MVVRNQNGGLVSQAVAELPLCTGDPAGDPALYTKDVGGNTELFFWDQTNAIQLTSGGHLFDRYIVLAATATYADIQAALNNYNAVYLSAGTYAITGNLVVPNGVLLSATNTDTDPLTAANVILNISSGFQIQAQRGSVQYIRVTVASGSLVNAVTCTGGAVLHTYVTTTAGVSLQYAFSGSFAELGWCSCANISGVNVTAALSTSVGAYQDIHNCYFVKGATTQSTVYVNNVDYVSLRDLYINAGSVGCNVNSSDYCLFENIMVAGVVGSTGIVFTTCNYIKANHLHTTCNLDGIQISTCNDSSFTDLVSSSATAVPIEFNALLRCKVSQIEVYNCTGTRGIYLINCEYNIFSDFVVRTIFNVAAVYGIYVVTSNENVFSNINVAGLTNHANSICMYIYQCQYSNFSNIHLICTNGWCLTADQASRCAFTGIYGQYATNTAYLLRFFTLSNCTVTQAWAESANGVGIIADTCTHSSFSGLYAYSCNTIGVHIVNNDYCSFDDIYSDDSTTLGISIGTTAVAASANTFCQLSGLQSYSSGTFGIGVYYCSHCALHNIYSDDNTSDGVNSTNNTDTQFSNTHTYSNGQHGVSAGSNDTYCTWTDVHTSANVGTNFLGTAAAGTCYYNGGFEQQGVAAANDNFPLANWTTANVLAIP